MKIALINENSQAVKNAQIYEILKEEAEKAGHTVDNYGMYAADDEPQLTYVKNGLLASILLSSGAADFVVTGCGTGQGAMLACNSFPNVLCGHVTGPLDAYLFGQVNDGNCIAMPFAQSFGWGERSTCVTPSLSCSPSRSAAVTPRSAASPSREIRRSSTRSRRLPISPS